MLISLIVNIGQLNQFDKINAFIQHEYSMYHDFMIYTVLDVKYIYLYRAISKLVIEIVFCM